MLGYQTMKRLFDIVIASLALLVTCPLILIGALAVKLTSPGPAFDLAKRAGLAGKPFYMLKLRSMRIGADALDRRVTAARDDRITAVGALLRKFKIDELPQLWNVLRGDMSIVGPRPEDWDIESRVGCIIGGVGLALWAAACLGIGPRRPFVVRHLAMNGIGLIDADGTSNATRVGSAFSSAR